MRRILRLAIVNAGLLVAATAWASPPPEAAQRTFRMLLLALGEGDAEAFGAHASDAARDRFRSLLRRAGVACAAELAARPSDERFQVLALRELLPASVLASGDLDAALAASGERADPEALARLALAGVAADATGLGGWVTIGGVPSGVALRFSADAGGSAWRLEEVRTPLAAPLVVGSAAALAGTSEDHVLEGLLERLLGRPIRATLAHPPTAAARAACNGPAARDPR